MSFVPVTPGNTLLVGLAADSYSEARRRLLFDAKHMPYPDWSAFAERGYRIVEMNDIPVKPIPEWYGQTGRQDCWPRSSMLDPPQ